MSKDTSLKNAVDDKDYKVLLNEVQEELRRNEAITSIVQLLEDEHSIDEIIETISEVVAAYLEVPLVGICKYVPEQEKYITVGSYAKDIENQTKWEELLEIVSTDSETQLRQMEIISTGEVSRYDEALKRVGFTSMIERAISLNNRAAMYLLVLSDSVEMVWDVQVISFMADVCRLIQSILSKRITQNSLASSYNALNDVLDNVGSGLYVIDKNTKEILFCNEYMNRVFGGSQVGSRCYDLHIGCEDQSMCTECPHMSKSSSYRETYDIKTNAWYTIKNVDITWVDGRSVSLCIVTDITEKKKYEKRIEFQANNDFLTGLYNRMRCEADITENIEKAIAESKEGMVMFLDLDDFKHINDGLGHQYGDMLLKMVSLGLQQIKGIENNCYRMGGDEFVILLESDMCYMADRVLTSIKELFNKPWYLGNTEYYCTMSMGIVVFPEDGTDVNELIKKADIAMYDAKKLGKNRMVYYNAQDEGTVIKRLDIEKNMRSAVALGCDEFQVFIQPIYGVLSEECIGGEALIRWNSDNLGFLGPGEFVPLAEHLGLINPIGDHFLKKACRINKRWSDMGVDAHINVNLSIVQLMQNNIVDNIRRIVLETGIKPQNLVLEVTESLAINDVNRMKIVLSELKKLGVLIALDDFGTGYSSLNYIKQMSFDIIKVDKSFVTDIVDDDYSKTFVKLITELSDQLNVKVCVEGVEKKDQLKTLRKMNVSMIQGYYYGKPMPYKDFERQFLGLKN